MGLTIARFTVSHPTELSRSAEVELLVDTGAVISFVPREILEGLGVPKQFRRVFQLASGQTIERDVGLAFFRWDAHVCGAPVVFGEPNDARLLGVTALEGMSLQVDPVGKTLRPVPTLAV